MFALGSALRDARLRQDLQLEEVEEQTRISRRYLRALEEERFELLPGDAYAKAFLRSYAGFLGLDAKAFADEYQTRLRGHSHQPDLVARPPRPRRRAARPALPRWGMVAATGVAALVGVLSWQLAGSGSPNPVAHPTRPAVSLPQTHPPPPAKAPHAPPTRPATVARPPVLILSAVSGACWIDVHLWSATGKAIDITTLQKGGSVRFSLRRPLWLRLGAPSHVQVTIAGKSITGLPTPPANYLATRTGLRPA